MGYFTNEIQQDESGNNNSLKLTIEEIDKELDVDKISFLFKTATKTTIKDDSTITLNGAVYPLYCYKGKELVKIPTDWLRTDMLYVAIWSKGGGYWSLRTMGSLVSGGGGGTVYHDSLLNLDVANQHEINVIKNVDITTSTGLFLHDSKITGTDGKNLFMGIDVAKDLSSQPADTGTVGSYNLAFGNEALSNVTTGNNNVALGANALKLATTSQSTIAIGANSLAKMTGGGYSVAIGYLSLNSNINKYSNVAIGYRSLEKTTGSNNTAIGSKAGNKGTGTSNCVFIGNSAGENETNSSKLHIANNPTESLIEGDFDNNWIVVKGTIKFQLPTVDDTASADNVGMMRYRIDGSNSYVDVCMQTGSSVYEWINIVTEMMM